MFKYISNKTFKRGQKETKATSTEQTSAPVLDSANEDFLNEVISGKGDTSTSIEIPQDIDLADIDKAINDELPEGSKGVGVDADLNIVKPFETTKEEEELSQVLQDLDLSAKNDRAYFLSQKSKNIVQKFTVILKDLINGVPTAYNDLMHLLEDSDGTLNNMYEKLPDFIKTLVAKLPDKMKGHLAPELVAAASKVPSLTSGSGIDIKELIANPGAIYTMLRAIMNVLKLRWPVFIGSNVLLSMGLFVLLFVFWYCYKRGKEERLKKEAKVNGEGRVEDLGDVQMIDDP